MYQTGRTLLRVFTKEIIIGWSIAWSMVGEAGGKSYRRLSTGPPAVAPTEPCYTLLWIKNNDYTNL